MFKFSRTFGTNDIMNSMEEKIKLSKTVEEAYSVIPTTFPDYIKEELKLEIKRYFDKK